ncbi:Sensors of blue-light using FAD [Roseovarius sp. THAF27]|uniref:BLUF domain-containing protein n=1 Tax=unclassified Roseovarius TaxID=2614913 RepID=UPI0012685ADA|nr:MULTISPECIES: BLUF domain-containing protein [unclassified Roseovarius]QFT82880.1 Sensors of blue-light using FAD [Roseovarius sp. THAF27]QFT98089.1 Sensors of blue-light using FAD [Roseovarius sp. THAF8]
MALTQLIYASRPFGYDDAMLAGILLDARRCNERDGITGALICRADLYLQLLEGPDKAVRHCYARIRQDDRHIEPRNLLERSIKTRLFPAWAMRDDPAQSWVWSREAVRAGAVEQATEDEVLGFFNRLAADGVVPFPQD